MPQNKLELQFDTPPAGWSGTIPQFIDLLQSLGIVTIPDGTSLMWVGANPPNSDQGPGFNTTLNQFMYWDGSSASYKTIGIASNIGEICMFAFSAVDSKKFVICDGRAIPRANPYDSLYAKLKTSFGSGDGSTTFNVPDLRGRVPMGAGAGTGLSVRVLGDAVGEEKHTLTANELPALKGSLYSAGASTGITQLLSDVHNDDSHNRPANPNGDGPFNEAHNNIQPSMAVVFAIRYA